MSRVLNATSAVAQEKADRVRKAVAELNYDRSVRHVPCASSRVARLGGHHRRHREPVLHVGRARHRGRRLRPRLPAGAVQLRRGRRQGGRLRRHRHPRADGRRRHRRGIDDRIAPRPPDRRGHPGGRHRPPADGSRASTPSLVDNRAGAPRRHRATCSRAGAGGSGASSARRASAPRTSGSTATGTRSPRPVSGSNGRSCAGPTSARTAATRRPATLLDGGRPPDALFVANNLMTLGALRAIQDLGARVPGRHRRGRLRRFARSRPHAAAAHASSPSPLTRSVGSPASCCVDRRRRARRKTSCWRRDSIVRESSLHPA